MPIGFWLLSWPREAPAEFCFSETFHFTTLRSRLQPTEFPRSHVRFFLLSSSQDTCSPQIWIRYFSAWLTSPWGVQTPTRGLQTLDSLSLAFVPTSFNSMVTLRRGQLFAVCKPLSSVLAPFGLEGSDRSFSSPSGRDSFKGSCTWFHRVLLPFCPFARDP